MLMQRDLRNNLYIILLIDDDVRGEDENVVNIFSVDIEVEKCEFFILKMLKCVQNFILVGLEVDIGNQNGEIEYVIYEKLNLLKYCFSGLVYLNVNLENKVR